MIDIHTHSTGVKNSIISLFHNSSIPDSVYFSIGVHPWKIPEYNQNDSALIEKIKHSRCLAIGECGLDKLRGEEFEKQISVFVKHIRWSEHYKKPLIIHCVKAFNEIIKLKKETNPKQAWIIHGFNSKSSVLKELLNQGFYISIGTDLMNNVEKLNSYMSIVPDNRLFFETDESELSISEIYKITAKIKQLDLLSLQNIIKDNFKNCFHIDHNGLA
jgi:TatD DNase family protein